MSANAQKAISPEYGDSSHSRRVLLVDEQAHILRVLRLNLDRHGYIVDTALNSENALLLMGTHRYDALIMTSDMPDMNTQQLCENAARYCADTVPLILVNCDGDDSWINDTHVVEKLATPVSLRLIVERLDEVFGGDE